MAALAKCREPTYLSFIELRRVLRFPAHRCLFVQVPNIMEDKTTESFKASCNKARALYEELNYEACAAQCNEILKEPECPRYYRIRALLLLGFC